MCMKYPHQINERCDACGTLTPGDKLSPVVIFHVQYLYCPNCKEIMTAHLSPAHGEALKEIRKLSDIDRSRGVVTGPTSPMRTK